MQVFRHNDAMPQGCAVALGYFDGLHVAHRELIRLARASGDRCAVLTFSGSRPPYIASESEKIALFEEAGADCVFTFDFDAVKDMTYDRFFEEVLTGRLAVSSLYCGYNYTFGKGAAGGAKELARLCERAGIPLSVTPEIRLGGAPVSSTSIKSMIASGDIEGANAVLGRPFTVSGRVMHGQALGRRLGFPTVNIEYGDGRVRLPYGVYFTLCRADGKSVPSVTNVGTRPTVDGSGLLCETYLLEGSPDLYGKNIEVSFLKFRRFEKKFADKDELAKAVAGDIEAARNYFENRACAKGGATA